MVVPVLVLKEHSINGSNAGMLRVSQHPPTRFGTLAHHPSALTRDHPVACWVEVPAAHHAQQHMRHGLMKCEEVELVEHTVLVLAQRFVSVKGHLQEWELRQAQ